MVRGDMTFDSDLFGDFIIVKSDGYPTYNFASPVDDAAALVRDDRRADAEVLLEKSVRSDPEDDAA